jgi:hypothetical protein
VGLTQHRPEKCGAAAALFDIKLSLLHKLVTAGTEQGNQTSRARHKGQFCDAALEALSGLRIGQLE